MVPNQSGWFVSPTKEYFTLVKVNSKGWVDTEHSTQKPEGIYRILIIGDSFVENLQVPLEHSFFKQIEKSLNEKYKKIEVITMGRGNTGTAQQLLILKNYGLIYQPGLVIHLFFSGNDVKNNSPVLQRDPFLPYFELDEKVNLKLVSQQKRNLRKFAKFKDYIKDFRTAELILSFRQKYLEKLTNKEYHYPLDYHIYDEK